MKKFYILLLAAWAATTAAVKAQDVLFMSNQNGGVIMVGAEVYCSEGVEDDFGDLQIPAGISVTNNGTNRTTYAILINYTVSRIDNGSFQICFPLNCITHSTTGQWNTASTLLRPGDTHDLLTEWYPADYGECVVTYRIMECQTDLMGNPTNVVSGEISSLTIHFVNSSSGLTAYTETGVTEVARYSLDGRLLSAPTRGINLVRLSDGRTVKQVVK